MCDIRNNEEAKIKWILDKTGCEDVTELFNYIYYLKDVQADYEELKKRVKELANIINDLY